MSYDFMMFKPRATLHSMADIQPANLSPQSGEAVKTGLTALFPAIAWEEKGDRGWLGRLAVDGNPYEFRIHAGDDECWTISTSEGNDQPSLVTKVCEELGALAFDGQALLLIDAKGSRPAA